MASVELKSISGKGIKSLVLFQKPSLYTVISLTNVNQPTTKKNKMKTSVDRSNGENPVWDQPIQISIDISHDKDLILKFDLKAAALLGDRVVGRAFIPVSDLDFSGALQRVSYQVKTPEGKSNGVLSFFYRADGPGVSVSPPPKQSASSRSVDYHPPPSSVPFTGFNPDISFKPSAPPRLPTPDPVILSSQRAAGSGYYPTVDPAVTYPARGTAAFDIYPPSATTTSSPPPLSAAGYYPTIEPEPSNVGGYYPQPAYHPQPASECFCRSTPQPPPAWYYPTVDPAVTYPTRGTAAFDIYRPSEKTTSYPPPLSAAGYYPTIEPEPSNVGGHYPPPAYPPQPASECFCRSTPQPPPAWYYPSAQQPAPTCYYPSPASSQQPASACFYPSPAPDVYGYQQQGWDRGLYGYN